MDRLVDPCLHGIFIWEKGTHSMQGGIRIPQYIIQYPVSSTLVEMV
jgi:hypothetical protein